MWLCSHLIPPDTAWSVYAFNWVFCVIGFRFALTRVDDKRKRIQIRQFLNSLCIFCYKAVFLYLSDTSWLLISVILVRSELSVWLNYQQWCGWGFSALQFNCQPISSKFMPDNHYQIRIYSYLTTKQIYLCVRLIVIMLEVQNCPHWWSTGKFNDILKLFL